MGSLSGITVSQFDDPFSVAGSSSAAPASHLDSRLFVSVCSVAVFEFLRHLEAGALAQQFASRADYNSLSRWFRLLG